MINAFVGSEIIEYGRDGVFIMTGDSLPVVKLACNV